MIVKARINVRWVNSFKRYFSSIFRRNDRNAFLFHSKISFLNSIYHLQKIGNFMPLPIVVDGSVLEGGGQLLRLCLSVSKYSTDKIKIHSIRTGRPKPGLSAQHLEGAKLVCRITGGTLVNDYIKSTDLDIIPGNNSLESKYTADAQTAGAISLMLQASLPCLIKKNSPGDATSVTLTLKGGTNVPFSPPVDHTIKVLFPLLARMGILVNSKFLCRGYYPRGGGSLVLEVVPTETVKPIISTEQGDIVSFGAIIYGNGELGTLIRKQKIRESILESLPLFFPNEVIDNILIDELHDNYIDSSISSSSSSNSNPIQNKELSLNDTTIPFENTKDKYNIISQQSENSIDSSLSSTVENDINIENNSTSHNLKKRKQFNKNNKKTNQNIPGNASENKNLGPTTIGIQLWIKTSTGNILSSNSFQQLTMKSNDVAHLSSIVQQSQQSIIMQALQELKEIMDSGACIDEHTADQLLVYMTLSNDSSSLLCAPRTDKSTLHLETAILILNQLSNGLNRLSITTLHDKNNCRMITCRAL